MRAWPLSDLQWLKALCGLIPVLGNGVCVAWVVQRHRVRQDEALRARYDRRIRLIAVAVMPFAAAAAFLGLAYFHFYGAPA